MMTRSLVQLPNIIFIVYIATVMLVSENFTTSIYVTSFRTSVYTSLPSFLNTYSVNGRNSRLFAKPKKRKGKTKSVASINKNFEVSEGSTLPANLKRKIQAKRPPLGHVVPEATRTKGCELELPFFNLFFANVVIVCATGSESLH